MRPLSGSKLQSAVVGKATLEVRGKPQEVAVYDFAKIKAQYAEHVEGTGHPGSYRIQGSLTDTQKVSLTVDPNGKVQLASSHFEPDPELGGATGPYPSRVDPIRNLFPEEVKSLAQGLAGMDKLDPAFGIVLERIGGKASQDVKPSEKLQPSEGKPLSSPGGMRGAGYDVVDKE
mgnify:CR=1 FL=1